MMILLLASVAAVFIAEPNSLSPKEPTTSPVIVTKLAKASRDPDEVVCKTEAVVGSHIPSRLCATNRDWAQRSQDGRDEMDDITRRNDMRPPGR